MAKKSTQRRKKRAATDQFKPGAKVEGLDNVGKLAASAAAANKSKGIGDNSSGITDDELERQIKKIKSAKVDVDAAQKILDSAKGVLQSAYKVAKDKGAPTDEIRKWIAGQNRTEGERVTEYRNLGRVMRVMGDPLYMQYNLFSLPEEDQPGSSAIAKMDAGLQGQHAYHNNEPLSNNPFQAGTENFVEWENHWKQAEAATARGMGPKGGKTTNGEAAAH